MTVLQIKRFLLDHPVVVGSCDHTYSIVDATVQTGIFNRASNRIDEELESGGSRKTVLHFG